MNILSELALLWPRGCTTHHEHSLEPIIIYTLFSDPNPDRNPGSTLQRCAMQPRLQFELACLHKPELV